MNQLRLLLFFSLIFVSCGLISKPTFAEELIVPVFHDPPWIITDQKPYSGIDVDIIKAIAAEFSLTIKYKTCPFARCLVMMKEGDADLMSGLFRRPEREEYMLFIDPPYFNDPPKVFYLKKGTSIQIKNYNDLGKLKIGVINANKYFEKFDNDVGLKKHKVTRPQQLLDLLDIGRIQTFLGTETQIDYLIAKEGFRGKFVKAPFRYGEGDVTYLAISKKSSLSKRIKEFNQVVQNAVKQGRYNQIAEEFFDKISKQSKKAK
ncbi:MAG: amino acid ABC transporter substrate-binding protein [Desulfamplus sp.]|nr:amino acid ABC transporter substrate-binding protein [Desulfamplus sp.]